MGDRTGTSVCRTLLGAGLFQMLEYAFTAPDPRVGALGVEILVMAAEERTKLVQSQILDETEANGRCTLFDTIILAKIANNNVSHIAFQYSKTPLRSFLCTKPPWNGSRSSARHPSSILKKKKSLRFQAISKHPATFCS